MQKTQSLKQMDTIVTRLNCINEVPDTHTTLNGLYIDLNVNRDCLRSKMVVAKVVPKGLVYIKGYKTNLYLKTDLLFLYSFDFTGYVRHSTDSVDNEHPFSNQLATKFIRGIR